MSHLDFLLQNLPNGASTIITGVSDDNKEVCIVVAKKQNKGYVKEVASKEAGRKYITELFGGKSTFCGKVTK